MHFKETMTPGKDKVYKERCAHLIGFGDKHIEIQYPKVVGYKDKLTENYMNQSIKDITEIYGYYSKYKNVEISYDISNMDDDVLSIVFTGTAKSDGAVSYKISETVSFNLLDSTNQIFVFPPHPLFVFPPP